MTQRYCPKQWDLCQSGLPWTVCLQGGSGGVDHPALTAAVAAAVAVMLFRYNSELRLSTLRWAVLAQLRKPPPGLEDVVKGHFR